MSHPLISLFTMRHVPGLGPVILLLDKIMEGEREGHQVVQSVLHVCARVEYRQNSSI